METKDMLTDINGKDSAKRIWGGRYLTVGLIMAIIWFIVYLGSVFVDKEFKIIFPYEMWYGIVGLGAGLIGIGIFETKNK